jgi:hypothetical protein
LPVFSLQKQTKNQGGNEQHSSRKSDGQMSGHGLNVVLQLVFLKRQAAQLSVFWHLGL